MADAYRQVADIYNDLNRPQKSLEYGLLAAHLNGTRTTAVEWADLGEYAIKLKRFREAAACFGKGKLSNSIGRDYMALLLVTWA